MAFLDEIEQVLRQAAQPLRPEEITTRLIANGWKTTGKTPEATVQARLAVDIKRNPHSRFTRAGKAVFALRMGVNATPDEARGSAESDKPLRPAKRQSPSTFLDAAEAVLDRFGSKRPMHYREITQKALDLGILTTSGKTPEATLYAQILTDSDRRDRRGERPRFVKHGKGYVGLARWTPQGLAFQIEKNNEAVRKQLHAKIASTDPAEFEALIGSLLIKLGSEDVQVTSHSGDGGVDVRGTMVTADVIRTRMAVQVKRWKNNVQAPTVQQVRGSLGAHEQGLIITTSDFSSGAREEAARSNATPVALMNGEQLVKLLVENDIGVVRRSQVLLELSEEEDE